MNEEERKAMQSNGYAHTLVDNTLLQCLQQSWCMLSSFAASADITADPWCSKWKRLLYQYTHKRKIPTRINHQIRRLKISEEKAKLKKALKPTEIFKRAVITEYA